MWDPHEIQARLATIRAADPNFTIFGARCHHHQLGPTLPEDRVIAFEAAHHVTLPDAYRTFLTTVGDGGAGPHYGLFPLSGNGMRDLEKEDRELPNYLATPFPHTQPWNPIKPTTPNPISEDDYYDSRWTTGSLVIAEFGCGAFHRLIITGHARGQVWFDDRASDGGLTPEAADFHSWYRDWFDRLSEPGTPVTQ